MNKKLHVAILAVAFAIGWVAMHKFTHRKPVTTTQFQTCVWPNRCKNATIAEVEAQFRPCVWPNTCHS